MFWGLSKNPGKSAAGFPTSPPHVETNPRHPARLNNGRSVNPLEVNLQAELNDPRVHSGTRNHTKCSRRSVGPGITELRRVESVEELSAELDVPLFTQKANPCPLDDCNVRV